jgi:outer membrane lipoprotein-sorting protein
MKRRSTPTRAANSPHAVAIAPTARDVLAAAAGVPKERQLTGTTGFTRRTGKHVSVRALLITLTALFLSALLVDAAAAATGPVPMPRLRPPYKGTVARADVNVPAAAIAAPPFTPNPNSPFTVEQQRMLTSINAYFNSFRVMEGRFIQFGPNGEQSEGVFFMTRPGRIRFHYSPPSKLDVVADGSSVAVRDGRTRTQQLYPLSATPLRYLLADHVDLTSSNIVQSIREEPDLISLVLNDRSAHVPGQLTLIFDRKTYQLRQWVVTDAQGLNTSVAIYDTTTGKPQNPNLFLIMPGNTF